ncbi:MAG TPA: helix-hairpin-helix domain-containing protein [Armatimonadota bacterium]|nr:helix-hairpin-helix domain-containing protein [Armatimonadota bacterium]HOM81962.1 helix-hairpin-helix domain-containing protein [Armatimonadota bacterium]HPO72042.1 helix-hairpin-helix domain-containing protein [Armatimonadota bacterium]HPT98353.1 helix-hairpin-helix domain-containing protein [Armatimonadota bacterium]
MSPPPCTQVYAAVALFCFLLLAGAGTFLRRRLPAPPPPLPVISASAPAKAEVHPSARLPSKEIPVAPVPDRPPVVVHVAGCVRQPGLYSFPEGARVYDAIKRAGGAKEGADLDAINLAACLRDGVQVYVPRKSVQQAQRAPTVRVSRSQRGDGAWIAPESIRLEPLPPAPAGRMPLERHEPAPVPPAREEDTPPRAERPAKIRDPSEGRVNINTADALELQRLPHVGPAIAQRILEYRKENGPFRSVDQLLEVRGIGEKYLARLRDLVEL